MKGVPHLAVWLTSLAALCSSAVALAAQQEAALDARIPPLLHVDGKDLKTAAGRVVRLQGVNIASLEWSNAGEHLQDSVRVATGEWKANAIRLPLCQDRWFGMQKEQTDGGVAYRQIVADAVLATARRGAYAILDLHWSDAGHWGHYLGQHKMPDQNSMIFWEDVARQYANHPAVLFDLYNEPHDVSWEVWKKGGTVTESLDKDAPETAYESPGMQKLVDVVRAVGAKNIVVTGGLDWAYDLSGVTQGFGLQDDRGNGIMYASHVYPWKSDWDNKFGKIAEKYPVLMGEVGCEPDPKQEDPYKWAPRILDYIDKHQLNWTAWCFHTGASPRLLLDWNYTPTPYWGAFVKKALQAADGSARAPGAPVNTSQISH